MNQEQIAAKFKTHFRAWKFTNEVERKRLLRAFGKGLKLGGKIKVVEHEGKRLKRIREIINS